MIYRVMIVDDHFYIREGLKLILETSDTYEVVAEAGDGAEALILLEAAEAKPDAILMDLNMPRLSGLETMREMKERGIDIPVIILTTYNEDELMLRGLELGARGYLLKDTGREALFRTLESALRGETLLQPEILTRVFEAKSKEAAISAPTARKDMPPLSDKERAVLQAIARGARSKEIALELGISERTVKAHLTGLYNKLGVDNRAQAVAVASERGLV
ncbi:response regulator [Cohnella thailandensis]|uniref:Response regulator transcription factor n=1 Tax=Cohnella thailandensis TaxID=557557 RepID=A0A841SWQ2_9BACL|nr:response regulator transcription factor [Cohnella thailandensis]MBB6634545.1 response regulator transcription factor [Cohnella thailandensis]MBP1972901.1 NarL family two-component system response regulator YdfI [Cohnella thailandensis]